MAFDEVVFPLELSRNSIGGPGFKTDIIETDSGDEERVARWAGGRHQWDVRLELEWDDLISDLKTFYMARQGAARGFLFEDPMDHATTTNGRTDPTAVSFLDVNPLAIGDGSTTQFQLAKHYISGSITHVRAITKPKTGTVKIGLGGSEQGSGWTVNTTTGIVTFTTAPGNGVQVQAGCEFYVPVRFGKEADEALRVAMLGGTAGELANVPIIEIKSEAPVREELPPGGLVTETLTASRQISPAEATTYFFICNDTTHDVILPNPVGYGSGFYFYVHNGSAAAENLTIKDDTGTTIGDVAPGGAARVFLAHDLGLFLWIAIA